MKRILLVLGLILGLSSPSLAAIVNSQGTSGAPISVTNSVATVLLFNGGRKGWCIEPETVAIRCVPSNTSAAASPVPSATVGFEFPLGQITCHNSIPAMSSQSGSQTVRLDCFSTGTATNVDTWEE